MQHNNVQSIGHSATVTNFAVPAPWGEVTLAGGPYHNRPKADDLYFCIKAAAEISAPYALSIPILDFSIPKDSARVEMAVVGAAVAARLGHIPFVGCMGGMGRTGTILGIMVKAFTRASRRRFLGIPWGGVPDPVEYVREHYNEFACETPEQQAYVREFDTLYLEDLIRTI